MSREGKLAKSTAIYFIGSFGSKILSFFLLPVYSNYLTTEAYGSYDLINTIIQIACPAVTLMLDNALYVYIISTDDRKRKEDIISFAIRTILGNCIIAVAVCMMLNYFYPIRYIEWVILWLVTYSLFNAWFQLARGLNHQKLYSLTGVIVTAITLMGNIVGLVVLKLGYRFLMISNCLAYTVSIIFLEMNLHVLNYVRAGHACSALKKELLKYTVPLLPNQLSWWTLNVSDRLMLTYYLGTGANGIYAMASKIPAVLNVVNSVFSAAWSDDILCSTDMRETEKYAERIYNMYIRLMIGIAIVLIATNRFLFEYIIAGNFVEAYKYTYFLYIGFIFSCTGGLLGAFYGYYKKSLNVSFSTIVAAAVNFLINILFLKNGIQVASISTCVGSVVIWLIRLSGLKGLVQIKVYKVTKLLFLILIPFYFVNRVEGLIKNLILTFAGTLIAIAINLNIIREMKTILFRKFRKVREI